MPVNLDDLQDAVPLADAASVIRVSHRQMQRIVANKEIEFVRLGSGHGRIYITRRALTEYLNRRRSPARS